jgi:hypothetical protein
VKRLRKIVDIYFTLEKKGNQFLDEKLVKNDIQKMTRDYYKEYKLEPTESEVKEFKKKIIMKKGLYAFSIMILTIFLFVGYIG